MDGSKVAAWLCGVLQAHWVEAGGIERAGLGARRRGSVTHGRILPYWLLLIFSYLNDAAWLCLPRVGDRLRESF